LLNASVTGSEVAIPEFGTENEEPVSETVTGASGEFLFEGIGPGTYVLVSDIIRPLGKMEGIISNDGKVISDAKFGGTFDDAGKMILAIIVDANRALVIEMGEGEPIDLEQVAIEDTSS
jgi:hypothetical protein